MEGTMKTNMGTADRVIRILAAGLMAYLWWSGRVTGALGIALLVFAGIFLVTSFVGFCALYTLIGLSTKKEPPAAGA
jgi:hypothetical protein